MHPVLIDFFGLFKLHTYGLMIAIAFLVGMQLAVREARRVDVSPKRDLDQFVLDLCFWILIVAMIGARLLFIIVNWGKEYSQDPLKILKFWEGGLVFYGGFVASVLFSIWFCRHRGKDFLQIADMLIPSVALGHFFGRLGCYAAGCCWGATVDPSFPLAVQFPAGSLVHSSMVRAGLIGYDAAYTLHLHPVQLYESGGELLIFFLLTLVRGRKRFHGQLLLVYLFLYPVLRTSLEFVRGDKERGVYRIIGDLSLSTSQIISIFVAAGAVSLLVMLQRRLGKVLVAPTPAADPTA